MTDSIESDRVHAARRARRFGPARGGRPTAAQRYALEFATTRADGQIPMGTNRRTVDVMIREGWISVAPTRITDAGRAAIGEPTTAAVQAAAERSAADQAAHTSGCRSWIDGAPYCDCGTVAADDRPAHVIAEELGLPVGAITPGPNDVPGADWSNPLPPRHGAPLDDDGECDRCECTGRITVHVDDDHGGYDGSAPCPACRAVPVADLTFEHDADAPAPSTTADQAARGEGWFVIALPAGPGTDQVQIQAEEQSRDDAHRYADVARRAMRLGGNDYGVVWACPTWSAVAHADQVAGDLVDASEHTHRRDCGSIDITGDYPDCSDRCEDASAVADDAVDRARAARETLTRTLAGDLYVTA